MTDREALKALLLYAQREAEDQNLDITAYLLSMAVVSLMPEGIRLGEPRQGTSVPDAANTHATQDEPLQ